VHISTKFRYLSIQEYYGNFSFLSSIVKDKINLIYFSKIVPGRISSLLGPTEDLLLTRRKKLDSPELYSCLIPKVVNAIH
jgi:hypothetical protein